MKDGMRLVLCIMFTMYALMIIFIIPFDVCLVETSDLQVLSVCKHPAERCALADVTPTLRKGRA